jgi:large subunit ribosomal protein L19
MNIVGQLEAQQSKQQAPALRPGETVRVHVKVVEGEKERTQVFEGIVIGMSGSGNRANFTVRKISYGVGVERIFPVHSPRIDKVEVVARGKVRRAKLYYLRQRAGKAARLSGEEA